MPSVYLREITMFLEIKVNFLEIKAKHFHNNVVKLHKILEMMIWLNRNLV